jgi:hypothetical protein
MAAYLIALQMVLAGAMSAQMAAAASSDLGVICTDAQGGTTHDPSAPASAVLHKDFCAVCAFAAHAAPVRKRWRAAPRNCGSPRSWPGPRATPASVNRDCRKDLPRTPD